jgi:predicted AAA+ superfamily ATPase
LDLSRDQKGKAFEHLIILQMIYLHFLLRKNWKFTSYRTTGGAEVDFVLETPGKVIGIEIKASKNVGKTDLRGLKSLGEMIPSSVEFIKWIFYLGDQPQKFDDGTLALPYRDGLRKLASEAF